MNYSVGQVGYFQLSNLVRNKVPFTLLVLNFEPNFETAPVDLRPLMAKAVKANANEILETVTSLGLKFEHPLVVLCEQGSESLLVSQMLEKKGFLNIYHVKGGWQNILAEAGVG
ncbi:MAG: hypothetical protein RJB66_2188 [Pseudomonadota bacterium]|jgi:rhodanese-related sulfurtransferase